MSQNSGGLVAYTVDLVDKVVMAGAVGQLETETLGDRPQGGPRPVGEMGDAARSRETQRLQAAQQTGAQRCTCTLGASLVLDGSRTANLRKPYKATVVMEPGGAVMVNRTRRHALSRP